MSTNNKKVPRISASGFAAAAVPQVDPVAAVQMPATAAAEVAPTRPTRTKGAKQAPSRAERVQIMGWFPAATRLSLKRVALENGKTLEQVMAEAFEQYLESQHVRK